MALPDLDVARVRRWCAGRVPEHARDHLRFECDLAPRHLTIVERRPPWHRDLGAEWGSSAIARLRFTATDKCWTCTGATGNGASTFTLTSPRRGLSTTS